MSSKDIRKGRVDIMDRRRQDEAFDSFVGKLFTSKRPLRRRIVTSRGVHRNDERNDEHHMGIEKKK
jgi:hypothetical protein